MTGVEFSYPDKTKLKKDLYKTPPHKTLSRWAALTEAMQNFFTVLELLEPQPRVGLITWASDMGIDSPVFSVDSPLSDDKYPIKNFVKARGLKEMLGATNCAAGIDAGVALLKNDSERPYANKLSF